jgi:flagellar hook-associated protein 3 FlgL
MTAIFSNSTSAFYERSLANMTAQRKETEALQAELGSKSKLTRSSDDPVVASRLRTLARADTMADVDLSAANRATADLQLTDKALQSFGDYIMRAKDIATQAANGTLSDTQRAGLGVELEQMFGGLVALGNSRDSAGKSLFGGQLAGDPYSVDGSGNAVYAGAGDATEVELGQGQTVKRGITGPDFLNFSVNGNPTDLMTVFKNLADALKSGTNTQQASRDGIDALTAGLDKLTTNETIVGSRLAFIDLTTSQRQNQGELRAGEEIDIGQPDLAGTMARLTQAMTVLEASQASFTKLSSLSLFNVIQ